MKTFAPLVVGLVLWFGIAVVTLVTLTRLAHLSRPDERSPAPPTSVRTGPSQV